VPPAQQGQAVDAGSITTSILRQVVGQRGPAIAALARTTGLQFIVGLFLVALDLGEILLQILKAQLHLVRARARPAWPAQPGASPSAFHIVWKGIGGIVHDQDKSTKSAA
jgi:hypothetical protein